MQDFESMEATRRIMRKYSERLMSAVIFPLCSIILPVNYTTCAFISANLHRLMDVVWDRAFRYMADYRMCVTILENPGNAPPISIPSLHLQSGELQGTSRGGVKN